MEKGSTTKHTNLVKSILLTCGARSDCRLWSNNTGTARALTHNGIINFGLPGSSDIIGIVNPGKFIGIEVKTGNAVQSKKQIAFMNMIKKFGGHYIIARKIEDVSNYLDSLHHT